VEPVNFWTELRLQKLITGSIHIQFFFISIHACDYNLFEITIIHVKMFRLQLILECSSWSHAKSVACHNRNEEAGPSLWPETEAGSDHSKCNFYFIQYKFFLTVMRSQSWSRSQKFKEPEPPNLDGGAEAALKKTFETGAGAAKTGRLRNTAF